MFAKNNKVHFHDQQLDDYVLENSVLKSKLQSKIDALSIMSKELDKCSMERDRFKILVEQLKCKKVVEEDTNWDIFAPTNTISGSEILARTKEHNNMLKLEVEMLKSKLEEANDDIQALRKQLQKVQNYEELNDNKRLTQATKNDYEQLLQELEKFKKKYHQHQLDYRATLDDKEELVSDRDYYKNKVQRLNHQISSILTTRIKSQTDENETPKPIVDIESVLTENKYLHERIAQLQVEKEIVKRTLTKYKLLLDTRSQNETCNIPGTKKGFAGVMTPKQGVTLDNKLQWSTHMTTLAGKLSSAAYAVRKIRQFTDVETAKLVYFAYFHSIMSYGIILWGKCADIEKNFVLQKRATRGIYNLSPRESLREKFKETVREYLDANSKTGLKRNSATELKSLCLGLFEALNDKSIALQHQRKTNQLLANRITELEKTLESWCNGEKCIPSFPSQMLIEELLDAGSVKSDESKEKPEREVIKNLTNKTNFGSEDDISNSQDELSAELNYENGSGYNRTLKKIVLPQELEELVKEALAEIKSVQ